MATSTRRTARKTAAPRKTTASRKTPGRAARKKASAPLAPEPTQPATTGSAARKTAAPARTVKKAGDEPKKLKLVRDSFTLPKVEYAVIGILKTRAARLSRPARKSEIVRAGLKALVGMSDAEFLACVSSLPPSRPKAKGSAKA
jgi:hypothetical protein